MKIGETYLEPDGTVRKIVDYDDVNKMVYVHEWGGHYKWVHEKEYANWVQNDTANISKIYIPDTPAQMLEEPQELKEEKPKKKRNKKTEDDSII